jgi:hypothetical protein
MKSLVDKVRLANMHYMAKLKRPIVRVKRHSLLTDLRRSNAALLRHHLQHHIQYKAKDWFHNSEWENNIA